MKYVYPAIFKLLESGKYFIRVPDLPGCVTEGKDLSDSLEMAKDAVSYVMLKITKKMCQPQLVFLT